MKGARVVVVAAGAFLLGFTRERVSPAGACKYKQYVGGDRTETINNYSHLLLHVSFQHYASLGLTLLI